MSIVDHIKREHAQIAEEFDHLLSLARDRRRADETALAAAQLVALVRIHSLAEERVFYEALRAHSGPLKAFALAAPYEHENLHTTLDKLLDHSPSDEDFQVIVKVARDLFEMHARDEEETDVLPLVAKELTPTEQAALAREMAAEEAKIRPMIMRLVGLAARAA